MAEKAQCADVYMSIFPQCRNDGRRSAVRLLLAEDSHESERRGGKGGGGATIAFCKQGAEDSGYASVPGIFHLICLKDVPLTAGCARVPGLSKR